MFFWCEYCNMFHIGVYLFKRGCTRFKRGNLNIFFMKSLRKSKQRTRFQFVSTPNFAETKLLRSKIFSSCFILNHFWLTLPFYISWKHQITNGFLVFSGGIKWKHWSIRLTESSVLKVSKSLSEVLVFFPC